MSYAISAVTGVVQRKPRENGVRGISIVFQYSFPTAAVFDSVAVSKKKKTVMHTKRNNILDRCLVYIINPTMRTYLYPLSVYTHPRSTYTRDETSLYFLFILFNISDISTYIIWY